MRDTTKIMGKVTIYSIVILIAAIFMFPILHTILTSFKKPVDAFSMPPKWLFSPTLKYHIHIWTKELFPKYLMNSLIIAASTVGISIPIACLGAYGFVRHRSRIAFVVLLGLLAIRMFPRILLVIPYYLLSRFLHLHDTKIIMILIMVAFNQPFSIWLMRGFFLNVPMELDEAALVDGCTRFGGFLRVVLPTVLPGIAATTIFSFLLAYNDFLFAFILTGTETKTLPVAIAEYGAESIEYWSISAAGVTGIITPVILIMLFLQKYLVKGLTYGALK